MLALCQAVDIGIVNNCTAFAGKANLLHVFFKVSYGVVFHNDHLCFKRVFSSAYTFPRVLGAVHNHGNNLLLKFVFSR